MPRRRTERSPGVVFHVMNRAVHGVTLFTAPDGYERFARLLASAGERFAVDLFAYCVMPNHWHLVIRPRGGLEMPAYMRWLTQTHAQRWRFEQGTSGRGAVYQGRYRWVPVQEDRHFLHVCRYVERNPLRAALVSRAEEWPWSSARHSVGGNCVGPAIARWPVLRSPRWRDLLNATQAPSVVEEIRRCVSRSLAYGDDEWRATMTEDLDLVERPRGRPGKAGSEQGIEFSQS